MRSASCREHRDGTTPSRRAPEGRPVERRGVDAAKRYSHTASTGRSPYVERRSATTKLARSATGTSV